MVSSVRSNATALRVPSNSFGTKVTRFAKAKGSVRGEDAPVTALYRTDQPAEQAAGNWLGSWSTTRLSRG
jgi:hypothetical protein